MADPGVSINIAPNAIRPEPQDLLLLEQERMSAGGISKANLVKYLHRRLYDGQGGEASSGLASCGLENGNLVFRIRAYPLKPGVQFRIASTVGELAGGEYTEIEECESVSFSLERAVSLRHPAIRLLAVRWLAGPWTTGGVRVVNPALSASGRELSAAMPLFGTAQIITLVGRYSYELQLDWESVAKPSLLGGWSEFVVAWPPPGRPVALELEEPEGASDMAESGAPCGGSGKVKDKPDDWPPDASPANKYVKCKYCELECEDEDK